MKKSAKKHFYYYNRIGFLYVIPIVVIIILFAGVMAALLLNTGELRKMLQQNMINYADDITAQLASNISSRMQMRETYIRNLADTFSEMPEFLLTEELLDRKASYLEMEKIFVVNQDGATVPSDIELNDLSSYLVDNPELYTSSQVFFTDSRKVFFSAPIIRANGENSLLIGVRTNAALQQMLQDVDFKDQGLCCIVDKSGTMVVSATNDVPFQKLSDIFNEDLTGKDFSEAQRVLKDIDAHQSGVAQFQDVGGESIMLGYDFLEINDWMLLTLVSSNLSVKNTHTYLVGYIAIVISMALLMILVLATVVLYYQRILKHTQSIALVDSLTGGRNYLAFRIEGENILQGNPQQIYAIVYLNIHNFKRFNERFGVKAGDDLLRQIYHILNNCLLEKELVARNAGDHFYLLLACTDEESVKQRLNVMMNRLEQTISEHFDVSATFFAQGAYLVQERETDFMIMVDWAKVASSYQTQNNSCQFYGSALREQIDLEHSLDESFQSALANHEFQLYIQPQICPDSKQICGGEVLVRWQHPKYGLLPPSDFVPLFERNGKICDLDFYMFEETCKLSQSWLVEGMRMPLSVNLSRAHMLSNDLSFLDRLASIKETYQIPHGLIELELTESLMLERRDTDMVTAMIDRIREIGLLCAIDDFGFGHSSLALLKDLNVTTVKLDRQFFLNENGKSWIVIRQFVQLAHELGMTVVAEGVEDCKQVDKLRNCGCDLIQGYVYAKPVPVSEFRKWKLHSC